MTQPRSREELVKLVIDGSMKSSHAAKELGIGAARMRQIVRQAKATGVVPPAARGRDFNVVQPPPPPKSPEPPPQQSGGAPPGTPPPAPEGAPPASNLEALLREANAGTVPQAPPSGQPSADPGAPQPAATPELRTYSRDNVEAAKKMLGLARDQMIDTVASYSYKIKPGDPELQKIKDKDPAILNAALKLNPDKADQMGNVLRGWLGIAAAVFMEFLAAMKDVRAIAAERGTLPTKPPPGAPPPSDPPPRDEADEEELEEEGEGFLPKPVEGGPGFNLSALAAQAKREAGED